MRVAFVVVGIICGIGFLLLAQNDQQLVPEPVPGDAHIVLTDSGFEPRKIHVLKGAAITFSTTRTVPFWPASDSHPNHLLYREFDPKQPLKPGEDWRFVFETPGTWEFHDHLRSYFTGVVYVSEK